MAERVAAALGRRGRPRARGGGGAQRGLPGRRRRAGGRGARRGAARPHGLPRVGGRSSSTGRSTTTTGRPDGRRRRARPARGARRRARGPDPGSASEYGAPFQEYLTRVAWGEVWGRPGLDRRTRSCLTLALLTALRAENEIPMHVRAAIRHGVTPEEIREVIIHAALYAGIPANGAFKLASRRCGRTRRCG